MFSGMQKAVGTVEDRITEILRKDGTPAEVIGLFRELYARLKAGDTGIIPESDIAPVNELPRFEDLCNSPRYEELGKEALSNFAICLLNGGLGTGMGLNCAKSSLEVKEGLTFNHIKLNQVEFLSSQCQASLPFLNMVSFRTKGDVFNFLDSVPNGSGHKELAFHQFRFPRLYADTLEPACEEDTSLNFNPPGHGDIYVILRTSGLLDRLLSQGIKYLFVSNSDNTGAAPDLSLLGYFAETDAPFMMEVTRRTAADRKGGHLAMQNSRYILRESSQAPTNEKGEPDSNFQNIDLHKFFNTNNSWLNLEKLKAELERHEGFLALPLIRKETNINPRDKSSRKVFQIETAMGAAIGLLEGALAIEVPRHRFAPVKGTGDLLVCRSDAYVLNSKHCLELNSNRKNPTPPVVTLPSSCSAMSEFEKRFEHVPSLINCDSLKVVGDIVFASPLEIRGNVVIENTTPDAQKVFPAEKKVLDNETFKF